MVMILPVCGYGNFRNLFLEHTLSKTCYEAGRRPTGVGKSMLVCEFRYADRLNKCKYVMG